MLLFISVIIDHLLEISIYDIGMKKFGVKRIIKKGISSRGYRIKQKRLKDNTIVQIEEPSCQEEKEGIGQILAQAWAKLCSLIQHALVYCLQKW